MRVFLSHPPLTTLADAQLTYPEVGATAGKLPSGYRHIRHRALLGHGLEVFDRCATALLSWEIQRGAGLHVVASHTPAIRDAVVSQLLGTRTFGLVAPCKVVYVVDEPDRRGFAYGTLPGHPESGEEAFLIKSQPDGSVTIELTAFSRPGSALSRIGAPVTQRMQDWMGRRYLATVQRIAGEAG